MVLGLLLVPGYIVAPVLFAKAINHHEAGMLAGHIFHLANMGVLFLATAVVAFWSRMSVGRINWFLVVSLMVLVGLNVFGLTPIMQGLKDSVDNISALPSDNVIHKKFAMYHGMSAVCHLLATVLAALLVAMGGRGMPVADKVATHG
jgi:hypothetical protein